MMTASNIRYEIADRTRAIAPGGIGAIHLLAQRTGLIRDIDERLHLLKRHLPYHESDHVLNIAYNLLAGGSRLEHLEVRRNDEVFLQHERHIAGNVALVLEDRLPHAERDRRVAEVLALTGLADFAHAWPRQLSGGMRQRVGIARALAVRPAGLLMDEPLSALDAQTRGLLLGEFAALIERTGITTIYVTHNLAEAVRFGQQIVVLSRRPGRVRAILRIDRPLVGREATDADLLAIEAELWTLIRDDAAAAERDIGFAPHRH